MTAKTPYPPLSLEQNPLNTGNSRPHRYSLCTNLTCNLACGYCYVDKNAAIMSLPTARKAIDFIFHHAPPHSNIEIGFFGGEPLLEFPLLKNIVELVERHPLYTPSVSFALTTNGTIFNDTIADFLEAHAFKVCISCDGPPSVQNLLRRTSRGENTADVVTHTLRAAHDKISNLLVNAVYHPNTFRYLPQTLVYLSELGLRRIILNPDFSATWTQNDIETLPIIYRAVADRYMSWYLNDTPHFISLIDTKIAVLIRGGYAPSERCQMGTGELAITPDGSIYPCERLIGSGKNGQYCIGSVEQGLDLSKRICHHATGNTLNTECSDCSMKDCCMNWCGCSNIFMTGYYNCVGPFLCASERASIQVALDVFTTLQQQLGPVFFHHLAGVPHYNLHKE